MLNNAIAVYAPQVPPVTNSYESIATYTVGSGGQSTVTFSSIPSTYKHLQIRVIGRYSAGSTSFLPSYAQFNGDTAANYTVHFLYGSGASATAAANTGQSAMALTPWFTGSSDGANIYGASVVDILDYANTSKNKTVRSLGGADTNGSGYVGMFSNLWASTAAINSITIGTGGTTFAQYSQFALYGIKG